MLSYFLNLQRDRITNRSTENTLVIVDDCCYSGSRIHKALEQQRARKRIIVAVLYSTEQVLREILVQEDTVFDCIKAHTLLDLVPLYESDEGVRRTWRVDNRRRFSGHRYWIGLPELVVFPWTEPDTPLWNRKNQKLESGWKIRSPDKCLGNWANLNLPPKMVDSEYRIPDKVIYRIVGERIYLFSSDSDDIYQLDGSASLMWRALAAYGNQAAVLDYLEQQYGTGLDAIHRDLAKFISDLLSAGLLEKQTHSA